MKPLTIGVTGLHATDNPGPGVPVIRALRDAAPRCRIVGLTYDALDPGNFMEGIADAVYLVPYPSHGSEMFIERLSYIQARESMDVVIPTLDSELPLYMKTQATLLALGIKTLLPDDELFQLRSKAHFYDLQTKLQISVPRSVAVSDRHALAQHTKWLGFPLMVKGQFYEAYLAHNPVEVEGRFAQLAERWGIPVILQEFIPGDEYDIVAVGDGQGGVVGAVPMRKMQLTDKGKAWGGVTVADPELYEFVVDVVRKLKWQGPCELEVMRARADGKLFLIEINPRFPAWVYLTVGAQRNLPWAVVRLALGESVSPMPPPAAGIMFLRHSSDQIIRLTDYEALITLAELQRST